MDACLLCKSNDADKTGSHLVPHFLLKRIENIDNNPSRDYELGFLIENLETKFHFGRSVPPDKLEKHLGEITEEDIEQNKHPFILDNIFCSACEKRLSVLESEYAKSLEVHDDSSYSSEVNPIYSLLFWASIMWRLSIVEYGGINLSKSHFEILRRVLDRTSKTSIEEINTGAVLEYKDILKLSYKILRCPEYSSGNATIISTDTKFRNPYLIVLDEYVIAFSFNKNYNIFSSADFFGLQEEIIKAPMIMIDSESETILPLNENVFKVVHENVMKLKVREKILDIRKYLNLIHVRIGGNGKSMPEEIKQEVFNELTADGELLGRQYSIENLTSIIVRVLQKHMPTNQS